MKGKGRFVYALSCIIAVIFVIFSCPVAVYSEEVPQEIQQETTDPPGDNVTTATAGDETTATTGTLVTTPEASPFTGALGYRIPIETPPGRNGIAPNLALTYSSQARNGLAGVGWTIDLGSIQRNTRYGLSYAADGDGAYVASINGSTVDLVLMSGSCYQSKIEGTFSKYCLNQSTSVWTVTAKDGTKYTYGQEADNNNPPITYNARQYDTSGNTSQIFRWYLNRVEDTNGNYMTITYIRDQNEIYPYQIKYTGNVNNGPAGVLGTTNMVEFIYQDNRPDTAPSYVPKFKVVTAKRLKEIHTYGGQLASKYALFYNTDTLVVSSTTVVYSRLTEVYRCNANYQDYNDRATQCLVPLTFTYSVPTEGFHTAVAGVTLAPAKKWNLVGDVNGDGKSDIIVIGQVGTSYTVYIADNNGVFTATQPVAATFQHFYFYTGDFNGDGKTDIATVRNDGLRVYLAQTDIDGNFTGFSSADWPAEINWDPLQPEVYIPLLWLGDFNGDGKTDIASYNNTQGKFAIQLSTGSGFNATGSG